MSSHPPKPPPKQYPPSTPAILTLIENPSPGQFDEFGFPPPLPRDDNFQLPPPAIETEAGHAVLEKYYCPTVAWKEREYWTMGQTSLFATENPHLHCALVWTGGRGGGGIHMCPPSTVRNADPANGDVASEERKKGWFSPVCDGAMDKVDGIEKSVSIKEVFEKENRKTSCQGSNTKIERNIKGLVLDNKDSRLLITQNSKAAILWTRKT